MSFQPQVTSIGGPQPGKRALWSHESLELAAIAQDTENGRAIGLLVVGSAAAGQEVWRSEECGSPQLARAAAKEHAVRVFKDLLAGS